MSCSGSTRDTTKMKRKIKSERRGAEHACWGRSAAHTEQSQRAGSGVSVQREGTPSREVVRSGAGVRSASTRRATSVGTEQGECARVHRASVHGAAMTRTEQGECASVRSASVHGAAITRTEQGERAPCKCAQSSNDTHRAG